MQTELMGSYGPGRYQGKIPSALVRHRWDGAARHDARGAARRAMGLGWFSVAWGLAQILAPGRLAKRIGTGDAAKTRTAMVAVGVREIVCGIGILARLRPSVWLWARVAGDVMDLALLGRSLGSRKADRPKVLASMASVAGVLVLDAITAAQLGRRGAGLLRGRRGSIHVTKAITVNRPPEVVYRFWRDLRNLPSFMAHLDSVNVVNGRSHWRARGPGVAVEWDAEMIEDRPNELVAWRSLEGADVASSGTVEIVPAAGGRGTVIRVDLVYKAPDRRTGTALAELFGENPSQQIESDLRRFKQVIETGEVMHSDASIHHRPHPARPPSHEELEVIE